MKNHYRELCANEVAIPVFLRDWWLDTVCGENDWNVLVEERNGKIVAAMPLYLPCNGVITMPQYTQCMGVWFAPEAADMKYSSKLEHRQAICLKFIGKLKDYKSFFQNFSYDITDWLPFYWNGYSQTTKYTYILDGLRDSARLTENMSRQTRRNIRHAEEAGIIVRRGISIDDFLRVQEMTFERQNIRNKQSSTILQKLVEECRKRSCGEIFGGYDSNGNLHSAAFVVWQKSSAYYIAGGGDPSLRSSGAHSLVMLEAIKYVSEYTDRFDFEGSMLQGVERFFREFGGVQKTYFQISKGKLDLLDRVKIKINMKRSQQ